MVFSTILWTSPSGPLFGTSIDLTAAFSPPLPFVPLFSTVILGSGSVAVTTSLKVTLTCSLSSRRRTVDDAVTADTGPRVPFLVFLFLIWWVRHVANCRYDYFHTGAKLSRASELGAHHCDLDRFFLTGVSFQACRRRDVFSKARCVFRREFFPFVTVNSRLLPFGVP